jgi:hypothetical protein
MDNHSTKDHRDKKAKPANAAAKADDSKVDDRPPLDTITCFACQERGHYANRCPTRAAGQSPPETLDPTRIRTRIAALREGESKEGDTAVDDEVTVDLVAQAIYEMESRKTD